MIRNRLACTPLCWIESYYVGVAYKSAMRRAKMNVWRRILEGLLW